MNILNEIKVAFKDNKKLLLLATVLFVVPFILGFIFKPFFASFFNPIVDNLSQNLKKGVITFTIKDIFANNFSILCKVFIFGAFCGISILLLIYNGFFCGFFMAGGNVFRKILLMMPHGIFEFASLIIGTAAGFTLFKFIYYFIKSKPKGRVYQSIDENINIIFQAFILFLIAALLMFIASIIEVYITIPFANFVISIL